MRADCADATNSRITKDTEVTKDSTNRWSEDQEFYERSAFGGAAKRRVRPESDRETSPDRRSAGSSPGPIRSDLPACVAGRPPNRGRASVSSWPP